MNLTPNVRVPALSRLQDAGKEQLRTVQHYFDRRHLEASLASLLQAANGHEGRGLAPGSALYQVLNRESQLLTTAYCQRWHVSHEHSLLTSKIETPDTGGIKDPKTKWTILRGHPRHPRRF